MAEVSIEVNKLWALLWGKSLTANFKLRFWRKSLWWNESSFGQGLTQVYITGAVNRVHRMGVGADNSKDVQDKHKLISLLKNWITSCFDSFFFFEFFNIYFWETERDRVHVGEGQREREIQYEAGSRLWAVSTEPEVGPEPTNSEIMTWAEVGHLTDWATQAPLALTLNKNVFMPLLLIINEVHIFHLSHWI